MYPNAGIPAHLHAAARSADEEERVAKQHPLHQQRGGGAAGDLVSPAAGAAGAGQGREGAETKRERTAQVKAKGRTKSAFGRFLFLWLDCDREVTVTGTGGVRLHNIYI